MLPSNSPRLYRITLLSVRPVLALLLSINLIAVASAEDEPAKKNDKDPKAAPWKVLIRPAFEIAAKAKGQLANQQACCWWWCCKCCAKTHNPLTYQEAYDSIPFSRAEYNANPAYRHEAAMELVFGVQRPTTIVKLPAGFQPQPAVQVNQNVFLGLYPSLYALRLGKMY